MAAKTYAERYQEALKKQAEAERKSREEGLQEYRKMITEKHSQKSIQKQTKTNTPTKAETNKPGTQINLPQTSPAKETTVPDLQRIVQDIKEAARKRQTDTRVQAHQAQKEYESYLQSNEYKVDKVKAQDTAAVSATNEAEAMSAPNALTEKEKGLKAKAENLRQKLLTEEDAAVMNRNMAQIETMPDEERALLEKFGTESGRNDFWLKNHKAMQELFDKYGAQKVRELSESYTRWRNQQDAQSVAQIASEGAGKDTGSAVTHSALSVGANLAGTVTSPLEYLGQLTRRTGAFQTMDPYGKGNLPNVYAGAVREQVTSDIVGERDSALRNAAGYAYQGVMGAADTAARLIATGGSGAASLALATSGSFGQTLSEASKQGATPGQAAAHAATSATIEALTEKIPLDELVKTAKGGGKGAVQAVTTALKQAGIEATTEEISLIGNLVSEAAILRDKSSYNQRIGDLVAGGMSYQEAKKEADRAILQQAKQTAIVSGISGGVSSAGTNFYAQLLRGIEPKKKAPEAPKTEAQLRLDAAIKETRGIPVQEQTAQVNTERVAAEVVNASTLADANNASSTKKESGASAIVAGRQEDAGANSTPNSSANSVTDADPNVKSTPYDEFILRTEDGAPFEAMGAASLNNSGTLAYNDLLSDDNVQRSRAWDVRDEEVPIYDADGRKVSEFVGNSMNSALTPDSFTATIKRIVAEGKASHDVLTNEETLVKAAKAIEADGDLYRSVQNLKDFAATGKTSPDEIGKAVLLYETLTEQIDEQKANGDGKVDSALQGLAEDTYVALAELATSSGRSVQLFSLFRKMTPEGQVRILKKQVERVVKNYQKQGRVKNEFVPSFDDDLIDQYRNAAEVYQKADGAEEKNTAEKQLKQIEKAIYLDVAGRMPATLVEKWNAWRYMAMLGNVKTQARNVLGNTLFMPYTEMKRVLGTAMERMLVRDKSKRTKALMGLSKADRSVMEWARNDAKTDDVRDALKYSAKLGDDNTRSLVDEGRKVFNSRLLEGYRDIVQKVQGGGDMLFKNGEYARSLAGFLKSRGLTESDILSGKVDQSVLNEGRAYAIHEAMKATFNDANVLSDALSQMRYEGSNPVLQALNTLGEGVLPFRRTPANVVVRFVENSPVNIARSLWNAATKVRKGEMSAATAIDQMASGLTGTGMMFLGYALANGLFGIKLQGSNASEEEKRQGHQEYAIEFSWDGQDCSYTIDWLAPANLPLFVGANIQVALSDNSGDTPLDQFVSVVQGTAFAFEPLLELSCLSSLNDLLTDVSYAAEGDKLWTLTVSAATSYIKQAIPSLARQTSQLLQENTQETFANNEHPIIRSLQREVANIPFVDQVYKKDKVDEWGQTQSRGNWLERALNAYINPGTLSKIDNSKLDQEITRLNGIDGVSVSPPDIPKTLTFTDQNGNKHTDYRLSEAEYDKLEKMQGQTAARLLNNMLRDTDYKALTDAQKAKAFEFVYDYAREKGRTAAINGYSGTETWMQDIQGDEVKTVIVKAASSDISDAVSSLSTALKNGWSTAQATRRMEEAYRAYNRMGADAKAKILDQTTGQTERYLSMRNAGISTGVFVTVTGTINSLKPAEGFSSVRDVQEAEAIAGMKLTDKEKTAVMKLYLSDAQDQNLDDMAAIGYGPGEYATAYSIYTAEKDIGGEGTKKRIVDEYQAQFGVDRATAEAIYQIYG